MAARTDLLYASLPAFVGLVYVPALIYDGNAEHFSTSFVNLLPWLLGPALVVSVVLGGATALVPGRPRAWARGVWLGTFLWVPISASIFQDHLILDGEGGASPDLATGQRWFAGVVATGVWLGLAAVATRWTEVIGRFSAFVAVAMLGFAVFVGASSWRGFAPAHRELPTAYSRDQNVIVVVLDKLQGGVFADVLAEKPALAEALDGFTWYPRAKGGARSTYLALPTIHSGTEFDATESLTAWFRRSIEEGSFVNSLADAGFDTTVVYPLPEVSTCPTHAARCIDGAGIGKVIPDRSLAEVEQLLQFAAFRIAPSPAKPSFVPADAPDDAGHAATGLAATVLQGNVVLDALAAAVTTDSPRPTLRFVHVLSTHSPIVVAPDCSYRKAGWRRDNAAHQAVCALTKLSVWFRALDAAGVYDNTTIVVLSDHGAGFVDAGANQAVGYANALLMVKPRRSRGSLAESPVATSLRDIGATVCAQTGACTTTFGHDVASPIYQSEVTTFFSYDRASSNPRMTSVPSDEVFRLRDHPDDFRSWERVSASVPCDGSASFDPEIRGLSTFGVGWGDYTTVLDRRVRVARSATSEIWVCLGEVGASRLEIEAFSPGKVGKVIDVLLDGASVGSFVVPTGETGVVSLPITPTLAATPAEHLVTFVPRGARLNDRYASWGKVAAVALR